MNIYRVQIFYIKRVISKFTKTKAEHKIKRKKKIKTINKTVKTGVCIQQCCLLSISLSAVYEAGCITIYMFNTKNSFFKIHLLAHNDMLML